MHIERVDREEVLEEYVTDKFFSPLRPTQDLIRVFTLLRTRKEEKFQKMKETTSSNAIWSLKRKEPRKADSTKNRRSLTSKCLH